MEDSKPPDLMKYIEEVRDLITLADSVLGRDFSEFPEEGWKELNSLDKKLYENQIYIRKLLDNPVSENLSIEEKILNYRHAPALNTLWNLLDCRRISVAGEMSNLESEVLYS